MRIGVIYYSMYGHVYRMAQAVMEGIDSVPDCEALLRRVPETLPEKVIDAMGANESLDRQGHVAEASVKELGELDGIIIGTPTRFGNMCAQMRQFLDATGELWMNGSLVGKPGSVFTSSNTQHGGQESTILSVHTTLLHQGMVVVGLPYSFKEQMRMDEITGCSPYGASTIAGENGERMPSENELNGARFQGRHVAKITTRLAAS